MPLDKKPEAEGHRYTGCFYSRLIRLIQAGLLLEDHNLSTTVQATSHQRQRTTF